jgi:hypothetical protein
MTSRARLVQSFVFVASIALGTSACNQSKLESGTQGLAVAFAPDPSGAERLNGGSFEVGNFDIVKLQALPVDPAAAAVYGSESLIFRLQRVTEDLTKAEPVAFSQIALPTGSYYVTRLEITHPALIDYDVPTPPVPTDPAHCMAGVTVVNTEGLGALQTVVFDQTSNITFTVSQGQSKLAIKLNVPAFIKAYEASFTCQVGCGTNDPTRNCLTAPFDETAFRAAVLANLTIQ